MTLTVNYYKNHTLAHQQLSHLQGKLHGPYLDQRRHPYSIIKVNEHSGIIDKDSHKKKTSINNRRTHFKQTEISVSLTPSV